jgi:hypothetical protein
MYFSTNLSFTTVSFPIVLGRCCIVGDCDLKNLRIPSLELLGCSAQFLDLQDADVDGSLFLHGGLTPLNAEIRASFGPVRLSGIRIRGNLECSHSTFDGSDGPYALNASGAEINGDVNFSDGFSAIGAVQFPGARIGGDVVCSDGKFKNLDEQAIYTADADIKGSVFLNDGFSATGDVQLHAVQIGGDLACDQGKFNDLMLERVRLF